MIKYLKKLLLISTVFLLSGCIPLNVVYISEVANDPTYTHNNFPFIYSSKITREDLSTPIEKIEPKKLENMYRDIREISMPFFLNFQGLAYGVYYNIVLENTCDERRKINLQVEIENENHLFTYVLEPGEKIDTEGGFEFNGIKLTISHKLTFTFSVYKELYEEGIGYYWDSEKIGLYKDFGVKMGIFEIILPYGN